MKSIFELMIGDLDDKRRYYRVNKQMKARVKGLPKQYRVLFKKMKKYLAKVGEPSCYLEVPLMILDLFESGAEEQKQVAEIVGEDPAMFCDNLILAANTGRKTRRDKLNQEIEEYFIQRSQGNV